VGKLADDPEEQVPPTLSVLADSVVPPAVQRFRLRGLGGELEGKSFDSSSDRLQIGSHPLNEVEVRDRTVSRFHCEVFVDRDGRAWVKDLGSRNGTWLNGKPLTWARPLAEGDRLDIAGLPFRCVSRLRAEATEVFSLASGS